MFRGIAVLAGIVLFTMGLTFTFITMTANGWTVVAGIGVLLVAYDLWVEYQQEKAAEADRRHWREQFEAELAQNTEGI